MYDYFDFDSTNMFIEWDPVKAEANFAKHGIRFETAAKVFADKKKLIREDEEHTLENRYNILGKVGKVLFVVCVFKDDNHIRLISARIASVPERRRYENGPDTIL